jgi:hypothetical protein
MRKIPFLIFVFGVMCVFSGAVDAQARVPQRLADVKSLYVDERSFTFTFSSCGTNVGGMIVVCQKHYGERQKFLAALKRWIEKSGFTLAADRDSADGIVQGTLSIDESFRRDKIPYPDEEQRRKAPMNGEAEWNVTAWAVNQNGRRIWQLRYDYPDISYGISGKPKIEGKRLAKAIEYDFRKKR